MESPNVFESYQYLWIVDLVYESSTDPKRYSFFFIFRKSPSVHHHIIALSNPSKSHGEKNPDFLHPFCNLAGGFKYFLFLFSPQTLGKWSYLTCAYFSDGLVKNQQLATLCPSFPHLIRQQNVAVPWGLELSWRDAWELCTSGLGTNLASGAGVACKLQLKWSNQRLAVKYGTLLGTNISPLIFVNFEDDFPFPFGGICWFPKGYQQDWFVSLNTWRLLMVGWNPVREA